MRIALAQVNPTVGDFAGNARQVIEFARKARQGNAGLVLFPELNVCGYPPRDLVEKPDFVARCRQALEEIAAETREIVCVCGFVSRACRDTGKSAMNSAAVLRNGKVELVQSKRLLPTYDVFDEMRNFAPAERQELFTLDGKKLALTICEDAWNDKTFWNRRLYMVDPVEELILAGGEVVLNISASPFHLGKRELRREMLASIARHQRVPVAMVNQVGGNDSLVFDGSSIVIGPGGEVLAQAKSFAEDLIFYDTETGEGDLHPWVEGEAASAFAALVLGTRDYVKKCGFGKALIGLSGGIDSALTAAIAVEALGAENVIGVAMPSQYSSAGSVEDARELAQNLNIRFEIIPIKRIFDSFHGALAKVFTGLGEDVTEENIQARARGTLLMAISNKFGALVLSTGNKSELGVGYCTLYGDMVGGLAVISDVPKTLVYRIAEYVNSRRPVIPHSTMTKAPSAELRPEQKDSDSLPPYDILDQILVDYVEDMKPADVIAGERKIDPALVRAVIKMVNRAEYKRQQAAPGLKISGKAFGVGRRFPVAARYEI